jgi:hypothetical protein
VQFLVEKANALDGLGLLRPSLVKTRHLNELRAQNPGRYADLLALEKTPEGFLASGWCTLRDERVPDAIILAYDTGHKDPIAFAMTHPVKRPWSITQGSAGTASWAVRFAPEQLPKSPVTITAWAFNATTGQAFQLSGDKQVTFAP